MNAGIGLVSILAAPAVRFQNRADFGCIAWLSGDSDHDVPVPLFIHDARDHELCR